MKTRIRLLFILPALMGGLALIQPARVTAQTLTNVYSFMAGELDSLIEAETNNGGASPSAGLLLEGNTLYGTTQFGGANGTGTMFAVNTDGTGFRVLHDFGALVSRTNSDGANPVAGLLQSGNVLFGTAENGGMNGTGTVFAVNTNGGYFTNLHNFTALSAPFPLSGTNGDGAYPAAGLTLGEAFTLYGTAQTGGANGWGTVFSLTIGASNFTTLHTFTAATNVNNSDGANPVAGLLLSADNILYGTTSGGGIWGNGAVFALDADGTGYTNLHSFSALSPRYINNIDGYQPFADLILSGDTLYGTTHSGGTNGGGTVFGVATNGTGFTNLYSFTGESDGSNPYAGLVISGDTLFGTAGNGGAGYGTLFSLTTNGAGFTILHTFTYTPDGGSPRADLILSDNTLYGTAGAGGTNASGMLFSLPVSGLPELTITLQGPAVVLTWPANATGFALQTTTNLDPPIVWTNVVPPPVAGSLNYAVTNIISDTALFYRLSQ